MHDAALCDDGGVWRLIRPLSPSDRLVELVEASLKELTADERSLLELVCVGEPLGSVVELTDRTVVAKLERRGLIVTRMDGRRLETRIGHPLYSDVLLARLSPLEARFLARSLAEAVEGTGARRREDALRVASWRLEGGGARPDLMLAAAATARWRFDFPLAERLARAAIEAGAGFDAAVLLAAQLAGLQGRVADAEVELVGSQRPRPATSSVRWWR